MVSKNIVLVQLVHALEHSELLVLLQTVISCANDGQEEVEQEDDEHVVLGHEQEPDGVDVVLGRTWLLTEQLDPEGILRRLQVSYACSEDLNRID